MGQGQTWKDLLCNRRSLLMVLSLCAATTICVMFTSNIKSQEHYLYVPKIEMIDAYKATTVPQEVESSPPKLQKDEHKNLEEPIFLHILAYQRTSSSVIGKMVGDLPGQIFIYEPLDMTFSALYNTDQGRAVPSDIFMTSTGQERYPDEDEKIAMQFTMDTIFQCKMSTQWPIVFLLHQFWFIMRGSSSLSNNYAKCISQGTPSVNEHTLTDCRRVIHDVCSGRYVSTDPQLASCKDYFWRDGHFLAKIKDSTEHSAKFTQFDDCISRYEENIRMCAKIHLDKPCMNANIRVVKTVRARMDLSTFFMDKYPSFRLLHLFRDPRGTVNSRVEAEWSQGIYEANNFTRIAESYCRIVSEDIRNGRDLEELYPGRVVSVPADDFFEDSSQYVDDISAMISNNVTAMKDLLTKSLERSNMSGFGAPVSRRPKDRTVKKGSSYGNQGGGEKRLQRWQDSMTYKEVKTIEQLCNDFYSLVNPI